jgi:hypothetical protein
VICITQNLFQQSRHFTDISLKYLVLFKNVRDKFQFSHLARQVFPEDSDGLYRAYLAATQPHGYLVLDLSQDRDDRLRFRTNIFPTENPPVIYAPIGDERIKSNYHALHVLKNAEPKLRKPIFSNCNHDLLKCICECGLNVLRGNVRLSGRDKSRLKKQSYTTQLPTRACHWLPIKS